MTCGAGGALNVIFKAILDPGDEVIVPRPYFVEYAFYVDNHGGVLKPVPSRPDFDLDLDAIEAAIGPWTKAVLINSPTQPDRQGLSRGVARGARRAAPPQVGRTGARSSTWSPTSPTGGSYTTGSGCRRRWPPTRTRIIASSYSKELSLSGERIGYAAANPAIPDSRR